MASDDFADLYAGLVINGKLMPGDAGEVISKPAISNELDDADLFEGLIVNGKLIGSAAPAETAPTSEAGPFEIFSGAQRKADNPELDTLPEFGATKEGDTPRMAAAFLSTFDPKAQMDMIQAAIPEAVFQTTNDGSVIIEVPTEGGGTRRSVMNRPGFSPQDLMTGIAQALSFVPAARLAGIGKSLAAKVGIGAAASGVTEQALQEGGVALGRTERDPLSTGVAAVTGGVAEAIVPAIQAVRGARIAEQVGTQADEFAQVADSINVAKKATDKTGVELFKAQQTGVPATLEKQAFVAQLTSGTKTAVKALKRQNKQAGEAVESFLNTIAAPESIVNAQGNVRNASRAAIDNLKKIRAEKASPLYKQAFDEGALVDLQPVMAQIDGVVGDMPVGGEVHKTLLKAKSLLSSGDEAPSLRLLHNAKLEIDQMLNKFGENSLGNTTKKELTAVQDLLLEQIDAASPAYKQAREVFAANSPAVTKMQDSIVGKIAKLDDTQLKQVTAKLFDASQANTDVMLKAKHAIKGADKNAWNDIVRTELERRLGSVKSTTEAGTTENLPGQLYRALFPNDKSTKVLMAAMDKDARANLKYLQTALGRARLGRPGGSQTAVRAEIKDELRGGFTQGVRDFLGKPLTGTVNYGINAASLSSANATFENRVSSMAKMLYDPKWKVEMAKIRKLNANSPATARAALQLLNDIESSDAKNSAQQ